MNVCVAKEWESSSCGNRWNGTWSSFAFPKGVRYLSVPYGALHKELGVSHAALPVSHTLSRQDPWQVGLWVSLARFEPTRLSQCQFPLS